MRSTFEVSRRRFLLASAALGGTQLLGGGRPPAAVAEPPELPKLDDELRSALQDAPLRMLFTGRTADDLADWQQQFSARLRELIGPHRPPADWSAEQLSSVTLADHTREEWLLKSDGVPSLPLYLLRPSAAVPAPHPIVLALHGHGEFGHDTVVGIEATPEHVQSIRNANYDYGRQMVRDGYLVVAPCLTPFGRRISAAQRQARTDPCAVTLVRMLFLGRTLLGANLRDAMWSLDFACRQPDARPERVACVGLSYGGRMTMVTAALDERIQAAVISGALNVYQERAMGSGYSCGAQLIPGLLEYGDTPEIGSLIAPRPCIWEIGSRDPLIVPGWAEQAEARLRRAYRAAGHEEQLQFHRFEGGHEWSGVTARTLFARHLKADS
jgi:dienelactone hydrolase